MTPKNDMRQLTPEAAVDRLEAIYAESCAALSRALERWRGELQVEAIQSRAASETDPLFGHRVVRLLFRVRRGWLDDPVVHVDLTAGRVLVEEGRPQ